MEIDKERGMGGARWVAWRLTKRGGRGGARWMEIDTERGKD